MNSTQLLRRRLLCSFRVADRLWAIRVCTCLLLFFASTADAQQQNTDALTSNSQYNSNPHRRGYDEVAELSSVSIQQLNINTATIEQLDELLPGIGPEKARRIVEWRSVNGPFQSIDQLLDVNGIGPRTLERIRPFLVLGDAITTSSLQPAVSGAERQIRLAVQKIVADARRDALEVHGQVSR